MSEPVKPARPCAKGHAQAWFVVDVNRDMVTPVRPAVPGEKANSQTKWMLARRQGLNPWCGSSLVDCPEPRR